MNVPNIISTIRIACAPIIVFLIIGYPLTINDHPITSFYNIIGQTIYINYFDYQLPISWLIAGVIFVIVGATDWLDGYLARKYNQVTTLGKFLDAAADKVLVTSVMLCFTVANIIPIWVTIIIVIRDIVMDIIRQICAAQNIIIGAGSLGKAKTLVQMLGLTVLFFISYINFANVDSTYVDTFGNPNNWFNNVILIPMYVGCLLSIVSLIFYLVNVKKQFGAKALEQATTK